MKEREQRITATGSISIKRLREQIEAERQPLTAEEAERLKTQLLAEELQREVIEAEEQRRANEPPQVTEITIPEPRSGGKKDKPLISQIEQIENWLLGTYELRRNTVNETIEFRPAAAAESGEPYRELTDEDENDIIYQLKRQGYKKPQDDLLTILKSSIIPKIDPVRRYYDNLQLRRPGAVARLARCVVLDDLEVQIDGKSYQELFDEYFRRWLTACYLCNIGRQRNDVMLILIGAQGRFKTSFLNHLCPESMTQYLHCGNINPSISDYNTATYLIERMIINVDDQMENIFGKDYNSMKSVITADFVSRRTLYAKRAKNRRRIANFCGSVNESHFLRDSNNRRYLCFKIRDIRTEYKDIDMDDVWAEIKLQAEVEKVQYVFGKEDFETIDRLNDNFLSPTEEDEALHSTFAPARSSDGETYLMQFTEILRVLKQLTGNPQLRSYNLQTAMRKYGYEARQQRTPLRPYPCHLYRVKVAAVGEQARMITDMIIRFADRAAPITAVPTMPEGEETPF